jgi:hypothetical protein
LGFTGNSSGFFNNCIHSAASSADVACKMKLPIANTKTATATATANATATATASTSALGCVAAQVHRRVPQIERTTLFIYFDE